MRLKTQGEQERAVFKIVTKCEAQKWALCQRSVRNININLKNTFFCIFGGMYIIMLISTSGNCSVPWSLVKRLTLRLG